MITNRRHGANACAPNARHGSLPPGIIAIFFASLAITAVTPKAARADLVTLHGSTTFNRELIEPHQAEIEKRSGHRLRVIPSRTSFGLQALAESRADLAMMSAPLAEELDRLGPESPLAVMDFRAHQISSTHVMVGVHNSNSVRKASLVQLRKVLLGEITDWFELGGEPGPILVTFVGQGGGVTSTVEHVVLKGMQAKPSRVSVVRTAVQLAWMVEQNPETLAFGQLSLLKQRGVPQLETDAPIEQPLLLVTKGPPTAAMKAVIDAARHVTTSGR